MRFKLVVLLISLFIATTPEKKTLHLFGNTGISIRHLLQKDEQIEELQDLILKQMKFKKESHYLELGETGLTKNLSTTGG